MASTQPDNHSYKQPLEVFTAQQLQELVSRIKISGVLGRSRVYGVLLTYLVECSITGKVPKEIEIAIEALGKGSDFDVSRDSAVRVYAHQLRKKLDSYYLANEPDAKYKIVIPKGQYALAAAGSKQSATIANPLRLLLQRTNLASSLAVILLIALLANIFLLLGIRSNEQNNQPSAIADQEIWQQLMDDDIPLLLVMGDYYIFGELNENGNIGRMVRDFNINSREDLEERHFNDWETTHNYQDLDLSYMPEGSAYALTRIIPILNSSGKRLNITMMSDLTTADIRSNHVIYIGYISALDKLADMVFAASDLQVGRSYDELLNLDTGRYYTSDAGLPEEGEQFRDYGYFSTFPASSENQVLVISGMRDAGLMHTAQALSDQYNLAELTQALGGTLEDDMISLEVLYEVFGIDRMNFDGSLVYAKQLDTSLIWGR